MVSFWHIKVQEETVPQGAGSLIQEASQLKIPPVNFQINVHKTASPS